MIKPQEIESARQTIQKMVHPTPILTSDSISARVGLKVYLKLENLQKTGSFKIRGASYKISKLVSSSDVKGVVAASAGNHAQGVALAASSHGIPATIVMPERAPLSKQLATRAYGGRVVLRGDSFEDAEGYALELEKQGLAMIHPFEDEDIITGQGTIGLEVMEALPDLDAIIVPIGGGGLISGVALSIKGRKPDIQVIGVEAAAASSALHSIKAGKIIPVKPLPSIADGIAVKSIGQITYPIIRRFVDDVVTVEEDEIAAAILMLMERKRIVAEGAGAVPLAALLKEDKKIKGPNCVLLISGGNIDVNLIDRIIAQGLAKTGRIIRIAVNLRDVPGSLANISRIIAAGRANILHIYHDRISKGIPIGYTKVILELETAGADHIREILGKLKEEDYAVERA
ncbi:MAG: threonine ammonia-lyase [Thermodesulfobacteriota bacterium]